jgi:hypothetical protein
MEIGETVDSSKEKEEIQDSVMVEVLDLQSPKPIADMYATPHTRGEESQDHEQMSRWMKFLEDHEAKNRKDGVELLKVMELMEEGENMDSTATVGQDGVNDDLRERNCCRC